jgi:hypothetical protein
VIERLWGPYASKFENVLAGPDRASLEEELEAVNLEVVVREGGETGAETQFIS